MIQALLLSRYAQDVYSICVTCGTQYSESPQPPPHCTICEEPRQYVGLEGQKWATLEDLRENFKTKLQDEESGLTSFAMDPHFGIGQRAFLIQTRSGNVLWDCISLLDQPTIDHIRRAGGLKAICISHPHYYTTMIEWSRTFDNAPIYIHAADSRWVMRSDDSIHFWRDETKQVLPGLTLIHCGGHFEGASVLHWAEAVQGKGAILSADTIQVAPDRRSVSFMWSYPNYVPLNASAVDRIRAAVEPFEFDRIYGAFPQMTIDSNAKSVIDRSAGRYKKAISENPAP